MKSIRNRFGFVATGLVAALVVVGAASAADSGSSNAELLANWTLGDGAPTGPWCGTWCESHCAIPGWTDNSPIDWGIGGPLDGLDNPGLISVNGCGQGYLSQQFPTIVGESYRLTFNWVPVCNAPTMGVEIGQASFIVSATPEHPCSTEIFVWRTFSYEFIANSPNTVLTFRGTPTGDQGAFLDWASVRRIVNGDCNNNGILDSYEIANGIVTDCNNNGIPDSCDILSGALQDCNLNGIADVCEIANGTVTDCNANGIPDSCDILSGALKDCNLNGIADICEIAKGTVTDVNQNGIPDSCDVASGLLNDYNHNGIADSAELMTVTAQLKIVTSQFNAVTAQLECGDLNNDGSADSQDLGLLLLRYGACQADSLTTPQEQEPVLFQSAESAKPR